MRRSFEGVFEPPAIGAERPPVPVAGPGRIDVGAEGISGSGFKAGSSSASRSAAAASTTPR